MRILYLRPPRCHSDTKRHSLELNHAQHRSARTAEEATPVCSQLSHQLVMLDLLPRSLRPRPRQPEARLVTRWRSAYGSPVQPPPPLPPIRGSQSPGARCKAKRKKDVSGSRGRQGLIPCSWNPCHHPSHPIPSHRHAQGPTRSFRRRRWQDRDGALPPVQGNIDGGRYGYGLRPAPFVLHPSACPAV